MPTQVEALLSLVNVTNIKTNLVYYTVSARCDKYNIVFDSDCNVLEFPDGAMPEAEMARRLIFTKKLLKGKIVW
ncbi:MAG: hypothetical protein ABI288_08400 [Ginsengibacter sp.]